MNDEVLVTVYGYGKTIAPGNRPWDVVASDRNNSAYEMLSFFNKHGIDASLFISGGTVDPITGESEAKSMFNNMKSMHHNLEQIVSDVVLDEKAKNTAENTNNLVNYMKTEEFSGVFGVTSMDHASRALRDGAYNPDINRNNTLFGVVSSKEPYSLNGSSISPFILEPPYFPNQEVYNKFKGLFKLDTAQKYEIADTISKTLSKK